MVKLFRIYIVLALITIFGISVSCDSKTGEPLDTIPNVPTAPPSDTNAKILVFPMEGGKQTFRVRIKGDWEIDRKGMSVGCSFSTYDGTGMTDIEIQMPAVPKYYFARSFRFFVKNYLTGECENYKVEQYGSESIVELKLEKDNFPSWWSRVKGMISFISNVPFTVEGVDSTQVGDWSFIHKDEVGFWQVLKGTIDVEVLPNRTGESRECAVRCKFKTIAGVDTSTIITFKQSGYTDVKNDLFDLVEAGDFSPATLSGWDRSKPIEEWECLTLSEDRQVIGLDLYVIGIEGIKPDAFKILAERFKRLTSLRLSYGVISENPTPLFEIETLKELIIESGCHNLVGVSKLKNLESLTLDCYYPTEFPKEVLNLPNLKVLKLPNNDFKGEIPSQVWQLTNLQVLDLSGNEFTGQLPNQVSNLTNIQSFNVEQNYLSDVMPSYILEQLANPATRDIWKVGNQKVQP